MTLLTKGQSVTYVDRRRPLSFQDRLVITTLKVIYVINLPFTAYRKNITWIIRRQGNIWEGLD